jgi:hypothetical protein
MTGIQQHIRFENLAKMGEFRSGSDPIYFKAWKAGTDSFAPVSAGSQFYGSEGDTRAAPHGYFSVGYVMDLMRRGLMTHPERSAFLSTFPNL